MQFPTYDLQVNWNNDGTTWTSEIANMASIDTMRGRDYASQLSGRASAGVLSALLLNPSGRYSSQNASSPLYGNIVPGRMVRVQMTVPSISQTTTIWQGYLDEIKPAPGHRSDGAPGYVTLNASGPLKYVGPRSSKTSVYVNVLTGTAIGALLDDAGWSATARTLDAGQTTMNRWKAGGIDAITALRQIEETEFGFVSESKDGRVVFEDLHHRFLAPHTVSQATFSDALGAALPKDSIEQLDPWREIYNRFEAQVTIFAVQAVAVLWSMIGMTPSIASLASQDIYAVYPTPSSATQADHVDAWTTPVATTDFTANAAADGSGADLTSTITVAVTKYANSMKITLTNTGATTAYLTFLQARGTAAYQNNPVGVASEDATSQGKYGKRTFPLPGLFYPSTVRAQTLTDYGLSRYKDPVPVLVITYDPWQSDQHSQQAVQREISDRITIVANGTTQSGAGLGINADFFIESEQHHIDQGGHRVQYALSAALAGDGGYWSLGVSTLGQTTKLTP